ncbi:hypothetical protein OAJ78_07330 [Gammaproteobacteria bacterium]|nr:hypothetical protein [Gammaproteobacteria bacterium]
MNLRFRCQHPVVNLAAHHRIRVTETHAFTNAPGPAERTELFAHTYITETTIE